MTTVRRFSHLGEPAPLPAAPPAAASPQIDARFASLAPAASPGARTSGADLERFRVGTSRARIALASEHGEQPFVRCVGCHADSHRHATHCQHCELTFDSDEQRRFNAELALQLRERRELADRRHEQELAAQQLRLEAEMERRQKRDLERERLDGAGPALAEMFRNRRPSAGLVLLRLVPSPKVRLVVLLATLAAFVSLWRAATAPGLVTLMSVVLAFLFMPRFGRRRESN